MEARERPTRTADHPRVPLLIPGEGGTQSRRNQPPAGKQSAFTLRHLRKALTGLESVRLSLLARRVTDNLAMIARVSFASSQLGTSGVTWERGGGAGAGRVVGVVGVVGVGGVGGVGEFIFALCSNTIAV